TVNGIPAWRRISLRRGDCEANTSIGRLRCHCQAPDENGGVMMYDRRHRGPESEGVNMKLIVALLASAIAAPAAVVPFDISGPGPGSIAVTSTADAALVN